MSKQMLDSEQVLDNVNTHSSPSALRITDMRIANLAGVPFPASIIRLDTNQGLRGYGEVRDWASPVYALMLKRQLIGENPCNVDKIFRKIKQFGHHARQAGGVCGVEMALMDLAGKAYGVPAYMLAGGKFRDKILCYCDTDTVTDGKEMGKRLKDRMDKGFKFLKMDVGIQLLKTIPDTLISPPGMLESQSVMHPFTGLQITEKGYRGLGRIREGGTRGNRLRSSSGARPLRTPRAQILHPSGPRFRPVQPRLVRGHDSLAIYRAVPASDRERRHPRLHRRRHLLDGEL